MRTLLIGLAVLLGCSSDEGYVTVRVVGAPEARAVRTELLAPESKRAAAVNTLASDGELGPTTPSIISGRHLLVTVTEVDVKLRPAKHHKHKHRKLDDGCNDGNTAGEAHEDTRVDDADDGDDREARDDDGHHRRRHWIDIFRGSRQIDLFDRNAVGSFFVNAAVPAGELREIRLVLSSVMLVENGTEIPVRCPSCATSGFKIKLRGVYVRRHRTTELALDVSPALVFEDGGYVLGPVIHLGQVICRDRDDDDRDDDDDDDD